MTSYPAQPESVRAFLGRRTRPHLDCLMEVPTGHGCRSSWIAVSQRVEELGVALRQPHEKGSKYPGESPVRELARLAIATRGLEHVAVLSFRVVRASAGRAHHVGAAEGHRARGIDQPDRSVGAPRTAGMGSTSAQRIVSSMYRAHEVGTVHPGSPEPNSSRRQASRLPDMRAWLRIPQIRRDSAMCVPVMATGVVVSRSGQNDPQ